MLIILGLGALPLSSLLADTDLSQVTSTSYLVLICSPTNSSDSKWKKAHVPLLFQTMNAFSSHSG